MNGLIEFWNEAAVAWWQWTVTATWQGSVLLLVIGVLLFSVKTLRPGMRYGLLLVVLLKLTMPPFFGVPYGFSDMLFWATTTMPPVSLDASDATITVGPSTMAPIEVTEMVALSAKSAVVSTTAWLLLVEALGAFVIVVMVTRQTVGARRLLRQCAKGGEGLHSRFKDVTKRMGVRRAPALYVSGRVTAPQSGGIVCPFIVLPSWVATLSLEEQDILLAHELAHVQRRDALVNGLQAIAQALLWWNPLVWWLNRSIREEREFCCDDLVLSRGIASGAAYSQTLVNVAERVSRPSSQWVLVGMADAYHAIDRRVRRALDERQAKWAGASYVSLVALLLLAGWVLPGASRGVESVVVDSGEIAAQPAEVSRPKFSMEVRGRRFLGVKGTGYVTNVTDGTISFSSEESHVEPIVILGDALEIEDLGAGAGPTLIRGDCEARLYDMTIYGSHVLFYSEGFIEFENATMDNGDIKGLKSERIRVNLADMSFEISEGTAESVSTAAIGLDFNVKVSSWIVEIDRDVELDLLRVMTPPDGVDPVEAKDVDSDEFSVHQPFIRGTASEEAWERCREQIYKYVDVGRAKIVASPKIVTRNGEEGTIAIGAAVPVEEVGEVVHQELGTKLGVIPTVILEEGKVTVIELQVTFEHSILGEPIDGVTVVERNEVHSSFRIPPVDEERWYYQLMNRKGNRTDLFFIRAELIESDQVN